MPEDRFLSGYTFRIRAVSAAGPGPASDPAVDGDAVRTPALNVSLQWEWDPVENEGEATLVWEGTGDTDLRWWSIYFQKFSHPESSDWDAYIPIRTTRYKIPATFDAGADIAVYITGCTGTPCGRIGLDFVHLERFQTRRPEYGPHGVYGHRRRRADHARLGRPDGCQRHHPLRVFLRWWNGTFGGDIDIPDHNGNGEADETSHTITAISMTPFITDGTAPVNGEIYVVGMRAANANAGGPWTEFRRVVPLAAGVPAARPGLRCCSVAPKTARTITAMIPFPG